MPNNFSKLLLSIGLSLGAGLIGSLFTFSAIPTWYATLNKPSFNPPNYLFGPVWTTLYILMGIALYLVWRKGLRKKSIRFAFSLFLIHLVVNSLWSIVFFGMHQIFLALVVILVLWLMIIVLIKIFWEIDKTAAYLLMPYLFWVSFATLLNFSIWQLNK